MSSAVLTTVGVLHPFAHKVSGWEPPGCALGRHKGALVSLNTWLTLQGVDGGGLCFGGGGGQGQ